MPGGDRTGPMGMGGRTGRATGYCADFGTPGYANPIAGGGFGRGYLRDRSTRISGFGGGGRGWRHMFYATRQPRWMRFGGSAVPHPYQAPYQKPDPEWEKQTLENQAKILRSELDAIGRRLEEIKTGTSDAQTE